MEYKFVNKYLANFNIAGFTYWDGCRAFRDLEIGARLRLVREEGNKFDPYAVAIYYEKCKLGFIPRGQNQMISQFLDMGYADIFEVFVQRISPDSHPEKQVGVVVFLKEAAEVFND